MDTASLAKLNQLHPKLRAIAIVAYTEACHQTPVNVHPFITEAWRSFNESEHLYQLGRTIVNPDGKSAAKPMGDIVSDATPGLSWHNYGLAFDIAFLVNGKEDYNANQVVTDIMKSHGFTWGGDFAGNFQDPPHFEMKYGYNIHQLLAKYLAKDFRPGTQYLNI